ncbi:MAG: DUF6932 family protein [Planctomycetaceae bacterium]
MQLPAFNEDGDLPPGVHVASLRIVLERFGRSNLARQIIGKRLQRIYKLATSTGHVSRFVVFGSFVTNKEEPNDVDVVLVMDETFDDSKLEDSERLLFSHDSADSEFGASVFWLRRPVAFGGEQAMIEFWQTKRDLSQRGIIEIRGES